MDQHALRARRPGWSEDVTHAIRGLSMGCADVVPGVSGGTVALILGIYGRLVTAVSRVDKNLYQLCAARQWQEAARYLDLRFLVALGGGILTGVAGMSLLINHLLTHAATRALTLAGFLGMILASAVLIALLIRPVSTGQAVRAVVAAVAAAALSGWISLLPQLGGGGNPSLVWLFICGAIGICAMILPGISGAMLLLVLGVYVHLTEVPHKLLAGEEVAHCVTTLLVFGSGCALSLVLFSKVLRWLLENYHVMTMAFLCGLMFGATAKLWPFQEDLTPDVAEFKYKEFRLVWPERVDLHVVAVLGAMAIAMAAVFATDYLVRCRTKR